jgi:hypothetical protein
MSCVNKWRVALTVKSDTSITLVRGIRSGLKNNESLKSPVLVHVCRTEVFCVALSLCIVEILSDDAISLTLQ